MCKRIPGIVVLFLGGLVLLWCVAACEADVQGRDAGSSETPSGSATPLDSALPGCDTMVLSSLPDGGPRAGPFSIPGFAFPHVDREKTDHLANARSQWQTHDATGALLELSKALYDNPNDFEAAMLLGETASQTGDGSLAGEVLDYATALKPTSDEPWLALTRLQLSGNKLVAAEKSVRHALRLNPKHAESHGLLGRLMLNRARWDQAIPPFEKALALSPNSSYFRNDLGLAYLMKHDFAKAVEVLKPLSERKDLPAFMYNNLGLAYEGIGLIQEASEQFEMALERSPGYVKARVNLDRLARQAKLAQTPPTQKADDTPALQPLEETPPVAPEEHSSSPIPTP